MVDEPELLNETDSGVTMRVTLEVPRCPACGRPMLPRFGERYSPKVWDNQLVRQFKAREWPEESHTPIVVEGRVKYVCRDCASADKGTFRCALCDQDRPPSQLKQIIGDPAECLCMICYETVPAKQWEDRRDELEDKHKYDWA